MANCPKLPLEARAAIERAREHIYRHAQVTWDMLFQPVVPGSPQAKLFSGKPKPDSLKLQFQEYSCALLDAEVPHYKHLARDEVELRSWLKDRSAHIAGDVIAEMAVHSAAHDFHCSSSERMDAMMEGFAKRIKYWVDIKSAEASKQHAPEDSISAIMERSRATSAHLKEMMARAKEVLEGSDAPTQKEAIPIPLSPPSNAPTIERPKFSKRASWLRDRLRERAWEKNDPWRHGGPDRKTIGKMLSGKRVREDVLERLAQALSQKYGKVTLLDIPTD